MLERPRRVPHLPEDGDLPDGRGAQDGGDDRGAKLEQPRAGQAGVPVPYENQEHRHQQARPPAGAQEQPPPAALFAGPAGPATGLRPDDSVAGVAPGAVGQYERRHQVDPGHEPGREEPQPGGSGQGAPQPGQVGRSGGEGRDGQRHHQDREHRNGARHLAGLRRLRVAAERRDLLRQPVPAGLFEDHQRGHREDLQREPDVHAGGRTAHG
ncbi:hypothetical protein Pka01_53540 [Planotetraspora kaengkrachanensis]|uniref:Uncharacterized protein n=1 Tax=Planotetraspora kaengkrachanensis TaxID=575193 RepID=A0A8J3V8M7_9ACTN|nr:hypothetical protein Pka01_53540 [Planotetraspora kaengkrachanensis]